MKRWLMLSGMLATAAVFSTGLAFGQSKPADCKNRAQAPERVEGQVVSVDPAAGKVTVREKNGTTHEFQANRETLPSPNRLTPGAVLVIPDAAP